MPKIIANVREQLLAEARRQIAAHGYKKTTIRSVANACGLGVGTVYNYFSSKDMLIASFMLADWQICLQEMRQAISRDSAPSLSAAYEALQRYVCTHQSLFADSDAAKVFATVFAERHKQLRDQLAEILLPLCRSATVADKAFLSEFVAEALLTWTVDGKRFEELSPIFSLLF